MLGRYTLNTQAGRLLFDISEKFARIYVTVDKLDGGMSIMPSSTRVEDHMIYLESVFFIEPGKIHELTLTWREHYYDVQGSYAAVGEIEGKAELFTGKTKYDQMVENLPQYKTGKRVKRTDEEIAIEVDNLLEKMTLQEKIGQMSQSGGSNTAAIGGEIKKIISEDEAIVAGAVGSMILMAPSEVGFEKQVMAVEQSRLGIPMMFCQDVIHGYQTIFPLPIAWSCSFNPDLVEKAMRVAAKEATVDGIMFGFSPMIDIARDPRWGRVSEGNGEDPTLCSRMCEAHVKGFQGADLYATDTMLACMKHFVGYSVAEGGRDYNTTEISNTTLHNIYLPPFQAGIEAGAASIMNSFNVMDNVPVVINKTICHDILRDEMGFDGILISDYDALTETIIHGAVEDGKEAAIKAVKASLDIEMASMNYYVNLAEAVAEGHIDEALINKSVRRILTYKFKTGLMDDPYKYFQPEKSESIYCEEHLETSYELARESIVLLKNKDVLPLSKDKKVALIGPKGDSKDVMGPWQFSKYASEAVTLKQGLMNEGILLLTEEGCKLEETIEGGIERAISVAKDCDVIVLALGEDKNMSGEAASRQSIVIPQVQMQLAMEMKKLGKPIILVLTNGRPLILDWFEENVEAIVETWFLGSQAGRAIADVLVGNYNPSGKLSMTFPKNQGQIPIYYNHLRTGRPYVEGSPNKFLSKYIDGPNEPLYSFGYGLSYAKFEVTQLALTATCVTLDQPLHAQVQVKNCGACEGTETLQLYIHDVAAQIARPVKELKDFKKVQLRAGESVEVSFEITNNMLSYYNQDSKEVIDAGKFEVFVGTSSRDIDLLKAEFTLV